MGFSVCAIARKYQKLVVDTPYLLKKRCWEPPEDVYVIAPYQFRKTFPCFPESLRIRFVESARISSEVRSL